MLIPERLQKTVTRVFGNRGCDWLGGAADVAEKAIEHWQLTDVSISPVLSHNLVCFAVSPVYGEVALKMGVPHDELFREMATLRIYDGRLACRMHDCDRDMAAMILERIIPGTDLWQLEDRSARIRVAGNLLRTMPVVAHCVPGIPLHREVVQRTFARIMSLPGPDEAMLQLMRAAEEAERRLYAEEATCDMLLHGDLNHWNILRQGTDQWRVIDPQGFVGPAVLDAGRFILNEMTYGESPCREGDLPGLITALADASGLSIRDVWRSALIDAVLSTCWHFEDGTGKEKTDRHIQTGTSIVRAGEDIF